MTADEIRRQLRTDLRSADYSYSDTKIYALIETAAQLAELNQNLRQLLDPKGEFIRERVEEAIRKLQESYHISGPPGPEG